MAGVTIAQGALTRASERADPPREWGYSTNHGARLAK
jgi:hypothetical protein